MRFKAIAIDDEPLALDLMQDYISKSGILNYEGGFTKPLEAFQYIKSHTVDLVFLDIEMPALNGIDLARLLPEQCRIIFTTAHRNFAPEAFEVKALDYLLKPIRFSRFLKAVERFEEQYNQSSDEGKIIVRADRTDHFLTTNDILYLEGLKDYTKVHTSEKTLLCRGSLGSFLKEKQFSFLLRVHKSFAINPSHITAQSSNDIHLGNVLIPKGKSYS